MRQYRTGSALLIVIGMVSFMVISSVAFSIYMRTSRMPSNYLRRGTSSRMLLKSALAGAIERIDGVWRGAPDVSSATGSSEGFIEGVYDDYYPGLNAKGDSTARGDWPYTGNRFVNRVFSPFRDVAPPADPNEPSPGQPIPVATLTLEGLAYLPPALINDVRLQSHRTSTACWCNLAYEYGRYAFCAVDVSDCFDVNKLRANSARTSAARQRIGFSTLFADEDRGLSVFDTASMRALDKGMSGVGSIPLVSMADFNIYMGQSPFTPFCKYVGQKGNLSIFGENDTVAANSLLITDTWFPPTNSVRAVRRYDLSGVQPFDEFGDDTTTAKDAIDSANATAFGKEFIRHLGGVGTVCLYDYLDADNVPTSFALPTVETAPMVCALGVDTPDGLKTTVTEDTADRRTATVPSQFPNTQTGTGFFNHKIVATPYKLDLGASQLMVQGQLVFPFKRLKDKGYGLKFKADVLVRIFFAPAGLKMRVQPNSPLLAPQTWQDEDTYVITRKVEFTSGELAWPGDIGDITKPQDAICPFQKAVAQLPETSRILFWKIEKYVATANGEPTTPTQTWLSLKQTCKGSDRPPFFDADGLEADFVKNKPADAEQDMFQSGTLPASVMNNNDNIASGGAGNPNYLGATDIDPTKYVPHVAVWMKVSNDDGDYRDKVVDVVPAYYNDDVVWGKRDPGSTFSDVCAEEAPPVLRFSGTTEFSYGVSAVQATANNPGELGWRVLYTVDPRFNYAPEAWYSASVAPSELKNNPSLWLNSLSGVLGNDGRDRDIFMFTSDQEYLQSMGELQFIPRLRDLAQATGGRVVEDVANWTPNATAPKTSAAQALEFMPDGGMLETYSAPDGDPVYNLGDPSIEIASSFGDFRVNPFTSDSRVFRAAIANTPYDWFAASTNDQLNLLGRCDYKAAAPRPSADDSKALSYTFSAQSACKSAKWRDRPDDADSVYDVADELSVRLREQARTWDGDITKRPNWEEVYDRAWKDALAEPETTLFGVKFAQEQALHGVDRKFLHGFWRECFGNRQQLFLVFLRAEPLTVGGSGTASMANAQTGARGVALVWRDPEPPAYHRDRDHRPSRGAVTSLSAWKCDNGNSPAPHRTRVLFYHQFD